MAAWAALATGTPMYELYENSPTDTNILRVGRDLHFVDIHLGVLNLISKSWHAQPLAVRFRHTRGEERGFLGKTFVFEVDDLFNLCFI